MNKNKLMNIEYSIRYSIDWKKHASFLRSFFVSLEQSSIAAERIKFDVQIYLKHSIKQ